MNLASLERTVSRGKKRLGQGHGSGRVKTSGRGTKGQKSRNKVPLYFEGGALPLTKRLPFLRGKGRNKSFGKNVAIGLSRLSNVPKGSVIDVEFLIKNNYVKEKEAAFGVKILADGDFKQVVTVKIPVSAKAKEKIEKAGGKVE